MNEDRMVRPRPLVSGGAGGVRALSTMSVNRDVRGYYAA
jgi:hypothetical protein